MSKWKKSSPALIETFYSIMEAHPQAELRKMFGYPCAFLNGNMAVGLHEENFAIRIEASLREALLESKEGAIFAPRRGRVMREYVALSPEVVADRIRLSELVSASVAYVSTLPVK